MKKLIGGSLLALAVLAGCGTSHSTVPSAAKASAKAEASALGSLPAAGVLKTTLEGCISAHINPLHPVKSGEAVEACMQAAYPGAHVSALTQCGVKVYFADHGNTAKENTGYSNCAAAAKK